jgi:6-pyruvoyltetrahydropterin/6-carboxytetrahydropterin synthase
MGLSTLPNGDTTMIFVRHNIEVAHRLLNLPGKCQQIHGHSMMVTMEVHARKDKNGYALGPDGTPLDFGSLKAEFRRYLDSVWDHHLHLNMHDPWSRNLIVPDRDKEGRFDKNGFIEPLPGLMTWPGDPSVENIALWIHDVMEETLDGMSIYIRVEETRTNGAGA